jgi:hypothetical protein
MKCVLCKEDMVSLGQREPWFCQGCSIKYNPLFSTWSFKEEYPRNEDDDTASFGYNIGGTIQEIIEGSFSKEVANEYRVSVLIIHKGRFGRHGL